MIRNVVAALAAALLAQACVTTGTRNAESSYKADTNGLLVTSVTASGHNPGILSYQIVRVAAPGETVAMIPVNDETYGVDWHPGDPSVPNGGTGRLAVVELPPGDYELRRGHLQVSIQERYASARRYGYRFTIAAGKATYLGNVHVDMEVSREGRLLAFANVVDRRGRDLPLLLKKYAALKSEQVIFPEDIEREAVLKRSGQREPAKLEDLDRLLPRK